MKLKLSDVLAYKQTYTILAKEKLPLRATYQIMNLYHLLENDMKFYDDSIAKIIEEGAQLDENGQPKMTEDGSQYLIDPEKVPELNKKLEELLNIEVEIDDVKINLEDFGNLSISVEDLSGLKPFIFF